MYMQLLLQIWNDRHCMAGMAYTVVLIRDMRLKVNIYDKNKICTYTKI